MNPPAPTTGTLEAAEDIRDIRGLVGISTRWDLVPWIALAIGIALVAALLMRWLRRPSPPPPPPTPDAVALAALERARQWMSARQAERFGTAISTAVRNYIEARFGVSAPRRTTDEFLRDLARAPVAGLNAHVARLEELLRQMDLVKFARSPLDEPQMEGLLDTAREFVVQTRTAQEDGAS